MSKKFVYCPDYAVHPGAIVLEYLDQYQYSIEDFSKKINWSIEYLNKFIKGKLPVNDDIAKQLSVATGMSVKIWLNLQRNYDSDIIRLKKTKQKEKVVTDYHHDTALTPLTAKA
jgi:addiction module HigA family antidote